MDEFDPYGLRNQHLNGSSLPRQGYPPDRGARNRRAQLQEPLEDSICQNDHLSALTADSISSSSESSIAGKKSVPVTASTESMVTA